MMKVRVLLISILFLGTVPAFAGTWIEDSLGFAFEYPRGWSKAVLRNAETARIQFAKTNKEAILQIDVVRRTKEYDLDRFIEETIDTFLRKYPDLKVVREKSLEEEIPGFDETVFLVLHYIENKMVVSNRFLFHKKGNMYYVIQAKTPRARYGVYAKDLDLIMKTFRLEPRARYRWRNDSLAYLDPVRDEKAIQYISITIRPIDSFPNQESSKPMEDNSWLNSVDPFKNPFTSDPEIRPNQQQNPNQLPNENRLPTDNNSNDSGPSVPPETDPL
ncbi:hypothetical protein [Leptospira idonii]|uniref:hypothetical protein n=1 Tax=Leptospira idonii TaxID=1193500 RepID=UPI001AEFB0EB|nr:hypothetical protein [Leptospira idonii]